MVIEAPSDFGKTTALVNFFSQNYFDGIRVLKRTFFSEIFSKDETSFWLNRSRAEENGYLKFKEEVFNSAGSSSNSVYLYADGTLEGLSDISLPQNRSAAFNTPYRLTMPGYSGEDGDGNVIEERYITDNTYWSITADSEKITWDDTNKYLVVGKDLVGGIYNAFISARYQNYTYEKM